MSLPRTSRFGLIPHQVFTLLRVVDFKLSLFCRPNLAENLAMDLEAQPPRKPEALYLVVCAW